MSDSLENLKEEMTTFFTERDWLQFHSPKNLVLNLGTEMGELMEHFRWVSEEQSYKPDNINEIQDEIGDVFLTLLHLANTLGIDPIVAAKLKLEKTAVKYPAEKCKGLSHKYTQYEEKPE